MADAVFIARWVMNEAASGTSPTTVSDDVDGNTLTIDYSSGDAEWTSVGAGNGMDFTATACTSDTAITSLANIADNGNIGAKLDGAAEASFIIVADIDAGANNVSRLFHIGTDTGDGDLAVGVTTTVLQVRWDDEVQSGAVAEVEYPIPSGLTVITGVIDTTEAVQADRVKLYYNNVLQTASQSALPLNNALDAINDTDRLVSIGNRPSGTRNIDGKIYYVELFTGQLTTQQITDSYDALVLDNDASWLAVTGPYSGSGVANAHALHLGLRL